MTPKKRLAWIFGVGFACIASVDALVKYYPTYVKNCYEKKEAQYRRDIRTRFEEFIMIREHKEAGIPYNPMNLRVQDAKGNTIEVKDRRGTPTEEETLKRREYMYRKRFGIENAP